MEAETGHKAGLRSGEVEVVFAGPFRGEREAT